MLSINDITCRHLIESRDLTDMYLEVQSQAANDVSVVRTGNSVHRQRSIVQPAMSAEWSCL